MVEVTESVSVPTEPDAVWELIGDPQTIADWHPAIGSSAVEGDLRHIVLEDGGRIEERITDRSDHSYPHEFIESPLPVTDYSSPLWVELSGEGTSITWESTFEPQGISDSEAGELVAGIYRAGLDAAAKRLG